jgi:hypothetical protein
MTSRAPLHVVPQQRGAWHVQREGDDRPLSEHGTATDAERAAIAEGAREIIVHDRYGRLHRRRLSHDDRHPRP